MKKQKIQTVMKYQEAFGLPLPTYEREREREYKFTLHTTRYQL